MPSVVDNINQISSTMDEIVDFLVHDEVLSKDFEEYLSLGKIEIQSERQLNEIMFDYLLDGKMQTGMRALEYCANKTNNPNIKPLLNHFTGIFKVQKILSNGFEVEFLASGIKTELTSMVKMHHLKQVGRYDYINARVLELDNVLYILQINDIISEFNVSYASTEAIRLMLLNPKSAYFKNPEKKLELKQSIEDFKNKFRSCFKRDYIVTTNKKADSLIDFFSRYMKDTTLVLDESLIEEPKEYRFFEIDEFSSNDEEYMKNALFGFSSHKETYDVGFWMDDESGLYFIPFLETFFKCFEYDIEHKDQCIREFLTSDKVPESVLIYANQKYKNFLDTINKTQNTNFKTIDEILSLAKTYFDKEDIFSPSTLLFNSELFLSMINFE